MDKMVMNPIVRFRVDFSRLCSIGPGKVELLENIDRAGSLTQAARALGLSYRRAWLLLHDINRSFGRPVTVAKIGGHLRGGMALTDVGKEIIRCYRAAAREMESLVLSELQPITDKAILHGRPRPGAPRKRLARRLRDR